MGFALRRTLAMRVPVNRAVDNPAGPQEKPLDFRTVFCSFRRLPAHTSVTGSVICSNSSTSWRSDIVNGFSTSLFRCRDHVSEDENRNNQAKKYWEYGSVNLPFDAEFPRPNFIVEDLGHRAMVPHIE